MLSPIGILVIAHSGWHSDEQNGSTSADQKREGLHYVPTQPDISIEFEFSQKNTIFINIFPNIEKVVYIVVNWVTHPNSL